MKGREPACGPPRGTLNGMAGKPPPLLGTLWASTDGDLYLLVGRDASKQLWLKLCGSTSPDPNGEPSALSPGNDPRAWSGELVEP